MPAVAIIPTAYEPGLPETAQVQQNKIGTIPLQAMGNESAHTNGSGGGNTPTTNVLNVSTTQVRPGGAPARVYLNEKVVPHLLEGMKTITNEQ